MPKGVEHIERITIALTEAPVIYPLMPKGVEHVHRLHHATSIRRVIYPLMPKGVEHSNDSAAAPLHGV